MSKKKRKAWSKWEDLRLRKALMQGGFPAARAELKTRTLGAIHDRAENLGLDVLSLGPVRLAPPADVALTLGVGLTRARQLTLADPLHVRRGLRGLALPTCRLQALLAQQRPDLENVKHPGLLTAGEAASRLGVTEGHFVHEIGPRHLAHVRQPVRLPGAGSRLAYLYPLDAVTDLVRRRSRREPHDTPCRPRDRRVEHRRQELSLRRQGGSGGPAAGPPPPEADAEDAAA
ncbi:hypothetical protein [Deinococcus sp. S9]|uniref:hypothetical protein n=1 Tax=Deinococcus sp. S9 TaxID=2545754 RepID=UPI001F0DF161|nr:hypothetical protein [Deinococcus sp. S9]